MTRKDYELIAEAIATTRGHAYADQLYIVDWIASDVAEALRTTNPRFDREWFLKACGVA